MKTLILLRGLPGAGKTTFASFLKDYLDSYTSVVAADDWMTDENQEYSWGADKLKSAHEQCIASVEWDMADEVECIIVHNTLTTEAEVTPYLNLAHKYNYQVVSLVVENRHNGQNVHDVPEATVIKMRKRFSVKL